MENTKIESIYGGVTFEQFEAAAETMTKYINGLIGTFAIKDLINDEHKANLKRDIALAALVDISYLSTQKRFHETIVKQAEEIKACAPTEPEKTENL